MDPHDFLRSGTDNYPDVPFLGFCTFLPHEKYHLKIPNLLFSEQRCHHYNLPLQETDLILTYSKQLPVLETTSLYSSVSKVSFLAFLQDFPVFQSYCGTQPLLFLHSSVISHSSEVSLLSSLPPNPNLFSEYPMSAPHYKFHPCFSISRYSILPQTHR